MRALKAVVIAMGVLITGATAALIVLIVLKVTAPAPHEARRPTAPVRAAAGTHGTLTAVLDEPAGSRILAMVPVANGLALALGGGGEEDRVVIIDPASGRVLGRVRLAR